MGGRRRSLAVGAAALAAVAMVGAVAPQDLVVPAAFRRPADLHAAQLSNDPVWRLGRALFFDARLSASGKTSCASCHVEGHGLSGLLPKAVGDGGKMLAFRAPTLLNIGSLEKFGWTGRFANAEAVSLFAMTSPGNMNMSAGDAANKLRTEPYYAVAFRDSFASDGIDETRIGKALSRYVSSIVSGEAPFDRWAAGDEAAVGDAAKRGFAVFVGKGRCSECHSGWTFTDGSYHDIGSSTDDHGRGKIFKTSLKLQYAFKTPGLRNVADRAPYMHDGSKTSLEEVVDLYDRGGIERPSRDEAIRPLHLSAQEKSDLVAFLKSLSGETAQFVDRR